MKKIVRYIIITSIVATLSCPVVNAKDSRTGRGSTSGTRTEQPRQPASTGSQRSGQRQAQPSQQRPAQQVTGNKNNRQPGGQAPAVNTPGQRPAQPSQQRGIRPVTPPPATHATPQRHAPHVHTPPPPPRHDYWPGYRRPVPPPHYVYRSGGPSFGSILGIALGTAFNVSVNYLYHNNYTVIGYNNDAIYLSNVNQMNYMWPNAVLYYNGGILSSSRYIYSTYHNDLSRYNMLYNNFVNQYGYPASVSNAGGTFSASWFGYDGRFVTIQYSPGYNANGTGCFYTTLAFGN